jgi:hypothetical protein
MAAVKPLSKKRLCGSSAVLYCGEREGEGTLTEDKERKKG